jgi:hypothetical protein
MKNNSRKLINFQPYVLHEATNVDKDAHLVTCVQYVLENDIKEFLYCKSINGRTMSLEVFNIINYFLQEDETLGELYWTLH